MNKPQGPKLSLSAENTDQTVPTPQEVESMLQLLGDFGRAKLSVTSLVLRPAWHDTLVATLQAAGLNTEETDSPEHLHWIYLFYRLGRILEQLEAENQEAASINMRCLAEQFGVPLSTATRIADQMVQRDLLERHSDPHDRRVVLIKLSPSGQHAIDIIDNSIRKSLSSILQHFNTEERQQILSLGRRLFQMWTASLLGPNTSMQGPKSEPHKAEISKPRAARVRVAH